MKPQEIEELSFQIIEKEAGNHGLDEIHWPVVRRMIHTSADFDYLQTVRFGNHAVEKGMAAIAQGCRIFTDTNMAGWGSEKRDHPFRGYGCLFDGGSRGGGSGRKKEYHPGHGCRGSGGGSDERRHLCGGNAPTALLRLIRLIKANKTAPALVIGLPVGFVNAAESKEALMALEIPYITNTGRKGGSNVAAAVVNALAIMADEKNVS